MVLLVCTSWGWVVWDDLTFTSGSWQANRSQEHNWNSSSLFHFVFHPSSHGSRRVPENSKGGQGPVNKHTCQVSDGITFANRPTPNGQCKPQGRLRAILRAGEKVNLFLEELRNSVLIFITYHRGIMNELRLKFLWRLKSFVM